VTDPGDLFLPKERSIAEYLAEHGMNVEKVPEVHDVDGLTNPDSIVRRSPDDPGVITEMKTLDSGSSTAVKDNIIDAGRQVEQHGGGHAVIDGRGVDLTEEDARRGFARAVGQARVHGQDMPEQVHFILGNGQLLTLPEI